MNNAKIHSGEDVKLTGKRSLSSLRTTFRLNTVQRTMAERLTVVLPHLLAIGIYLLLATLVTWPLVTQFTTGLVGRIDGVDAYQGSWNLWWVAYALTHGQSPFYTSLLFYPHGTDLFWQTLQFSHGVTALPVTLSMGSLAAFNFTVLSSFIIGGYATFLLARTLTASTSAALVAGTIYAFSPFHLERTIEGPLEITSIHWIPLYVFALYLLLERPSLWHALVSSLLLLWVTLGGWYYGLFCVLYTGCAVLVWVFSCERGRRVVVAVWGTTPLLFWGGVLAPRIMRLAAEGDRVLSDMRDLQIQRSADLLDFFWPNPMHPWWGQAIRDARTAIYSEQILWNVALGWVGLILAILAIVVDWKRTWRWGVLLLATMILALGPVLRVAGYHTGIPLPFMLLQDLPGIRAGQRYNHIAVISILMVALMAAYAVVWLIRRFRFAWHQRGMLMLVLVGAIVFIDGYAGPLQIVERSVHPFYALLPKPQGALLPLPLYYNINRSEHLTPQTVHTWPILGGYVARPPAYPFIVYTPGVRELVSGQTEPNDIVTPGWPESGRRALAAYDIQYVTMDLTSDKHAYFARVQTLMQELGFASPLVSDAMLEAYTVPPSWPLLPLGFLGPGWQPLEADATHRWRWMGDEAEIWLVNPLDYPVVATISLTATSYQRERTMQLELDTIILSQWAVPTNQVDIEKLQLVLSPGEHTLTLRVEATPDPLRDSTPISVRMFHVNFQTRPIIPGVE
jgi:hypothetical protein